MAISQLKEHTAWIMERGGKRRIHEVTDIASLTWERVRDDISQARIVVSVNKDSAQAAVLANLRGAVGRYELAIWRGTVRVWEGPITLVTFKRESVEIEARDVLHYISRLWLSQAYDNRYPNVGYVVERALTILTTELTRKDVAEALVGLPSVNVLPYIVDHQAASDARTSALTLPLQYTVFEHIDNLASNSGIDYTVVGRALHLWDVDKEVMGRTRTATENDFLGELYVSIYGMELATRSGVSDGQGNYGIYGGTDDYYGLVERLATPYDEDASEQPTQAELESQAQRNLFGRNPVPLQVRVPDGSSINMDGVFTIEQLVPGCYVPLRMTIGILEIAQMQKISVVKVSEKPDEGETVQLTMYPAAHNDDEVEE
jgi:hypothetical protein